MSWSSHSHTNEDFSTVCLRGIFRCASLPASMCVQLAKVQLVRLRRVEFGLISDEPILLHPCCGLQIYTVELLFMSTHRWLYSTASIVMEMDLSSLISRLSIHCACVNVSYTRDCVGFSLLLSQLIDLLVSSFRLALHSIQ